jgi:transposase
MYAINTIRTSMTCCGCGEVLKQVDKSRVYRCETHTHDQSCSVFYIDRDNNAAENIGMCGVSQLLGRERPSHLVRKAAIIEADIENELVLAIMC